MRSRWVLALVTLAACANEGPWLHVTATNVPAGPVLLRARVTVGELAATQNLGEVSPGADGAVSFVVRLPSVAGTLNVTVEAIQGGCVTARGQAGPIEASGKGTLRVEVPLAPIAPDCAPPDGSPCGDPAQPCCESDVCRSNLACLDHACACFLELKSVPGKHACATRSDHQVWCWGANGVGQLGVSTTSQCTGGVACALTPVRSPGDYVIAAAPGADHTCVLDGSMSNDLICWGGWPFSSAPSPPLGTGPWSLLASGNSFTCAAREANGSVACLGRNLSGALGTVPASTSEFTLDPVTIAGLANVKELSVGEQHACALTASGDAWCWGRTQEGQAGVDPSDSAASACPDPPNACVPSPQKVMSSVQHIAAGQRHTCAVKTTQEVFCWGADNDGQLGDQGAYSPYKATPIPVATISATAIAAAGVTTCIIDPEGYPRCWGGNEYGQFGNVGSGIGGNQPPTLLQTFPRWPRQIAVGPQSICMITDSQVLCAGKNDYGQLGTGNMQDAVATVLNDLQCP